LVTKAKIQTWETFNAVKFSPLNFILERAGKDSPELPITLTHLGTQQHIQVRFQSAEEPDFTYTLVK